MSQASSRRASADDRFFRLGTGFFAFLIVALVLAIFFELFQSSRLSSATGVRAPS